jgi:hypothetical protein
VYDNPLGAAICTVSDRENVALAELFDAVIVYVVEATAAVAVPEITPVAGLRFNPAGRAGATEYAVTVPVTLGVIVNATPTVAMSGLG